MPVSRFDATHDGIAVALARRFMAAPSGLVETYPGEVYPVDNTAALALLRVHSALRRQALWIITALLLQIAVGVGTVLFAQPIVLAVAHNFVAAVLLATLVVAAYRVSGPPSRAGFAVSRTLRKQK